MHNPPRLVSRRHAIAAAAAPLLMPMAAGPAAAEAETFSVFFDWQKTTLGVEGKKLVAALRGMIKPSSRVTLAGHCDTSEADPAKMSLTRAIVIASELAAGGVPADVPITVIGKGATELRVPTGAKAREPQNRYVSFKVE